MTTVSHCIEVLEAWYDPGWAESWDAVGLAVGDPAATLARVLFAVDPTEEVAAEAVAAGAGLLVTHHPLFLRGVHGVAETSAGGRVVATLVRGGCALYTAHTNADVACPGVSDALAAVLGLRDVQLVAPPTPPARAGGPGRPGGPGRAGGAAGLGRVGDLPEPVPLRRFLDTVVEALPATAAGVRATGDPDRPVRRVAVCGGTGGGLAGDAARAGADVLVTADARHHHTLDAVAAHPVAIVDVAHWASEWPWLGDAAGRLHAGLTDRGRTVKTLVSTTVTDPWRVAVGSPVRSA